MVSFVKLEKLISHADSRQVVSRGCRGQEIGKIVLSNNEMEITSGVLLHRRVTIGKDNMEYISYFLIILHEYLRIGIRLTQI